MDALLRVLKGGAEVRLPASQTRDLIEKANRLIKVCHNRNLAEVRTKRKGAEAKIQKSIEDLVGLLWHSQSASSRGETGRVALGPAIAPTSSRKEEARLQHPVSFAIHGDDDAPARRTADWHELKQPKGLCGHFVSPQTCPEPQCNWRGGRCREAPDWRYAPQPESVCGHFVSRETCRGPGCEWKRNRCRPSAAREAAGPAEAQPQKSQRSAPPTGFHRRAASAMLAALALAANATPSGRAPPALPRPASAVRAAWVPSPHILSSIEEPTRWHGTESDFWHNVSSATAARP